MQKFLPASNHCCFTLLLQFHLSLLHFNLIVICDWRVWVFQWRCHATEIHGFIAFSASEHLHGKVWLAAFTGRSGWNFFQETSNIRKLCKENMGNWMKLNEIDEWNIHLSICQRFIQFYLSTSLLASVCWIGLFWTYRILQESQIFLQLSDSWGLVAHPLLVFPRRIPTAPERCNGRRLTSWPWMRSTKRASSSHESSNSLSRSWVAGDLQNLPRKKKVPVESRKCSSEFGCRHGNSKSQHSQTPNQCGSWM